jgi:hypothetical protein
LVRLFTIDRQCLPESAQDGETFRRICDDELIAESVALRGLEITAVFAAAVFPSLTGEFTAVSCHGESLRFRQWNTAPVLLIGSGL